MRFSMISRSGVVLGIDMTEADPAVRLEEGRPEPGQRRPLELGSGEQTVVSYPLSGGSRLVCRVTRTDMPAVARQLASEPETKPAVRRPRSAAKAVNDA